LARWFENPPKIPSAVYLSTNWLGKIFDFSRFPLAPPGKFCFLIAAPVENGFPTGI